MKSGQGCVCCVWRSLTGPGKSKWWNWTSGEGRGGGWKETVGGFLKKRQGEKKVKEVFQNLGDLSSEKEASKIPV